VSGLQFSEIGSLQKEKEIVMPTLASEKRIDVPRPFDDPDDRSIIYGYSRVSTGKQQKDGLSLESQEIQMKKFFEATFQESGARWGGVFMDGGISGKMPFNERPAGKKLYERLRPGDHVIMTRLDRGFRNFRDCINVTTSWLDRGVNIHLLDLGMSTNTVTGRFIHRIFAALAEMMREIIVENITAGIRRKIEKYGSHDGRFGMGWKNVGTRTHPKRAEFVEERKQMALICHLKEDHGLSYISIVELFRHYGFTAPGGSLWSIVRIFNAYKKYINEGWTTPTCEWPPPPDYVPPKRSKGRRNKEIRKYNRPSDSCLAIQVKDSTIPSRVTRLQSPEKVLSLLPPLLGHPSPAKPCEQP
jgi:DNA invertase Pin-like site-specific DNA recombinase